MEASREFLNKTNDTCVWVDLLCRRMSYRPLELPMMCAISSRQRTTVTKE